MTRAKELDIIKRYRFNQMANIGSKRVNNLSPEQYTDEQLAAVADNDAKAMCELITRYTKLIRWKASRLCSKADADDLAQEGFMGLLSAVAGYDESRNIRFSTYADTCITNRMLSLVRSSSHIPMPIGDTNDPLFETEDISARTDSIVMQREEWSALWKDMITRLSEFEYHVCLMFMGGAGYAEIARELNVSPKAVDNALQRAKRKLRNP